MTIIKAIAIPFQLLGGYWALLFIPAIIFAIVFKKLSKSSGYLLGSSATWLVGVVPLGVALLFVISPNPTDKNISFVFNTVGSIIELASLYLFIQGIKKNHNT